MRRILVVPESLAGALPLALRERPSFEIRVAAEPGDVLGITPS
jgi:hypothetical protein